MYKDGVYQNHRSQGTIFHPLTYLTYWGHSAQKHLGLIAPPVHQHSYFDWTWAAVQECTYLSLPLGPGQIAPSSHTVECHCLRPRHTKREDKRGASSYKAQLGSEPAVDGGRKGGIEVSFSSTGRDIHPSFVGRRESVRYQCSNVISLALSRAPECHTGSEAK